MLFGLDFNVVSHVLLYISLVEIPLHSDAGSDRLQSTFSEVISYCWICLIVFQSCRTFEWQRRILLMWPWPVYGWWRISWIGTKIWIRWRCSRTCYCQPTPAEQFFWRKGHQ